jgi:hypothetical protein
MHVRFGLAALVSLTVGSAGRTGAQELRGGGIAGTVLDGVHTRRIAGVRVVGVGAEDRTNVQRSATSDSLGFYHLDSLPAGRYTVGFEPRMWGDPDLDEALKR